MNRFAIRKMSISEWKKGTLGDIAEIEMGQSPPGRTCNTTRIGYPLLNGPTGLLQKCLFV
jgi:hypothetical protein